MVDHDNNDRKCELHGDDCFSRGLSNGKGVSSVERNWTLRFFHIPQMKSRFSHAIGAIYNMLENTYFGH